MDQNLEHKKERAFTSEVFNDLAEVALATKGSKSKKSSQAEVTLLTLLNGSKDEAERERGIITARLKKIWGPKTPFGFFDNATIGKIFMAGPLCEVFLFDVDGKKLAELSEGPYGILRGLGMNEAEATAHIKALAKGKFLVLTRLGYDGTEGKKHSFNP